MKSLLVAATLVAFVASALEVAPEFRDRHLWERFSAFKRKYNKEYPSVAAEEKAFAAYVQNVASGAKEPTSGENEFSDQSFEQFAATHMMPGSFKQELLKKKATLPKTKRAISAQAMDVSAWDWRNHPGVVTRIKDQGKCGSCWSFSAAGNMEGQWFLYNGTSVSLSEQELVSCARGLGNKGCHGGSPQVGDSWLTLNADGYWATDAAYPYRPGDGNNRNCTEELVGNKAVAGARIAGWEMVHDYAEDKMAGWLVEHGPIGVCLDATKKWMKYTGGVLTNCGKVPFLHTDHCVLLVGFNNTEATPYWIVKNSWGTKWGIDGYMYLEKGVNRCNVAEVPYSGVAKKFD